MPLLYLDTNIYLDHFDGRVDRLRPLGEFAFQLLRRAAECEFEIIVSSLVLDELFYNSYEEQVKQLLPSFDAKGKIVRATVTTEDVRQARLLVRDRKTPFNDTLHAVVAHRLKADYLVTRNLKDFALLQDLVRVSFPESL